MYRLARLTPDFWAISDIPLARAAEFRGMDEFLFRALFERGLQKHPDIFIGIQVFGSIKRGGFQSHSSNLQFFHKLCGLGNITYLRRFVAPTKRNTISFLLTGNKSGNLDQRRISTQTN
nr:hypothetical protein [uncultured Desulfobulbus sp.]